MTGQAVAATFGRRRIDVLSPAEMRRLSIVLLLALVTAACGAGSTESSSFDRIPTAIAFDWLNAVGAGESDQIAAVVEPNGLVILAAAENSYSMEETAALLQSGFTETLATTYWSTFRQEFAGFAGVPFEDLEVGVYEEFDAAETRYAVVTIRGQAGDGTLVTASTPEGWRIDMAATVGPAFATQIRQMAEGLDDTSASVIVARALRTDVLPGLQAASQLDPDNIQLADEIDQIEQILPPLEPETS